MLNAPAAPDRAGLRCIAMLVDFTRRSAARLVIDPIGRLRNLPTIGAPGPTPIAIGAGDHVLMLDERVSEILPIDFAETAYDPPEPGGMSATHGSRRLVVVRAGEAWHLWALDPGVAAAAIGLESAAEVELDARIWVSQGDTLAAWDDAAWSLVPVGPRNAAPF